MTREKVDWLEVRKEYVTDNTTSYAELAKKHGLARKTVQARGTREQWPSQRQTVADEAYATFKDKTVEEKSQAQERHLIQYRNLQSLTNKAIQEMSKAKKIPLADLERLARSLKLAIDGERVVLGIPTTVTALSDPQGDSVWTGLAALIQQADEVLEEHGELE